MKQWVLSVACAVVAVAIGSWITQVRQNKKEQDPGLPLVDNLDIDKEKQDPNAAKTNNLSPLLSVLPQLRQRRIQRFVNWFQVHGREMHPQLDLTYTREYGHALRIQTLTADGETTPTLHEGTQLLKIPSTLRMTPDWARSRLKQQQQERLRQEQQGEKGHDWDHLSDFALLAAALLMEYCQSSSGQTQTTSFYYPYIDILMTPVNSDNENEWMSIPVLSSFSNDELDALEDSELKALAKNEWNMRQLEWNQLSNILGIQNPSWLEEKKKNCLTQDMYEYSHAVVTSHCTVNTDQPQPSQEDNSSDDVAHPQQQQQQVSVSLIPMADMINHAPRADNGRSFQSYHIRDDKDGSTIVLADRTLLTGTNNMFVWEEYNKLDNSIYLIHFGFCPLDNPYHCVMLQVDGKQVCVGRNGTLPLVEEEEDEDEGTGTRTRLNNKEAIRRSAVVALQSKSTTNLQSDLAMLQDLEEREGRQKNRRQMHVALRSRIEDKKLLYQLSKLW